MRSLNSWLQATGIIRALSTLLCCALPIVLVSLGLGTVLAWLVSHLPWLVWVSEHAIYFISLTLILLIISGYLVFFHPSSCDIQNKKNLDECHNRQKYAKIIWFVTAIILLIGAIFKYGLIYFI